MSRRGGSRRAPPPAFAETPGGLVTPGGVRFRTTPALLRDYAGPVVEAVGLEALVRQAEVWVRAPSALFALALLGGLFAFPAWGALAAALGLAALATLAGPGLAAAGPARALAVAAHPVAQGLAYVGGLSALAAQGAFAALGAGLAGFVAVRLGLVDALLGRALGPLLARLYPLPPPDQALRTLIVRAALRRGVPLPGTDAIERRVRAFWTR